MLFRCMYGLSSDIATLHVPEAAVSSAAPIQIAYDRGEIYLRPETSANARFTDVVARLRISTPTLIDFETFVFCKVETPPSDQHPSQTFDVVKSAPTLPNRVPLQIGYTLDFFELSLKLELTGHLPALSPLSPPPPDLIVAPVIKQDYSADVAETTSPKSKGNGEPAAMPPAGMLQQHLEAVSAVERTTEDPDRDPVSDHDAETEEDDEGDLDLPPDAIALNELPTGTPIPEDSDEGEEIFQKPKLQVTYAKQRSSSPLKAKTGLSKAAPSIPESSPKNVVADFSDEETARVEHQHESTHDMVGDLSEPMGSAEVAQEAASRSIPRATPPEPEPTIPSSGKLRSVTRINKRKFERPPIAASASEALDDDDEEEDDQATEPPKKRGRPRKLIAPVAQEESQDEIVVAPSSVIKKRGRPRKSAALAVQEETDPLDDDEGDDQVMESPKKRGRPRKSLAPAVQAESLDEIVVAPSIVTRKPQRSSRAAASSSSPAKSQHASQTPLSGKTPKVLLSSFKLDAKQKTCLKAHKVTVVDETPSKRTNFVCVVPNDRLPPTVKVLKTLVANKRVVSESWITDSKDEGFLLDLDTYVPPELQANIGNNNRKSIFAGKILYFTPQAAFSYGKEDWQNVTELGTDTGARSVMRGSAIKGHQVQPKEDVVFFGLNDDRDNDAASLMKDHGRHVYDKKFFGKSIIRAELDLDDEEFRLSLPLPEEEKASKE
ncbi:hypothetical protein HII31_13679 [Pseudocercospora fuligena]|uniref:BRCT domain-containing protein n=1 Tax=Pseudocercospora fuligena TaxID=685502 RepID=A0A8H6R360_9PEZI|nr:hypothetical protein HII31_13679 [Pseudocercospora fuligena]